MIRITNFFKLRLTLNNIKLLKQYKSVASFGEIPTRFGCFKGTNVLNWQIILIFLNELLLSITYSI